MPRSRFPFYARNERRIRTNTARAATDFDSPSGTRRARQMYAYLCEPIDRSNGTGST